MKVNLHKFIFVQLVLLICCRFCAFVCLYGADSAGNSLILAGLASFAIRDV